MKRFTLAQLSVGDQVAHMGRNEHEGVKFWGTIVRFECWLIWVKPSNDSPYSDYTYALNAWDVCDRIKAGRREAA